MIGVFGGTFNPIHVGHVRAALDVGEQLNLKHIKIMPANLPPHREMPNVSSKHRAAMVKLAIKNIANLKYEGIELQRDELSYTYNTLKIMRKRTDQPLVLILGTDAFSGLPSWYRWKDILKLSHIAVMRRPGSRMSLSKFPAQWVEKKLRSSLSGECGQIVKVATSRTEISSTEIRQRMDEGRSIRYLVPESVETYIVENNLYL